MTTPTGMATSFKPDQMVLWNLKHPIGVEILLPISPVPASRPRVTRWGTYYTKTYKEWMAAAHDAIAQNTRDPLDGNLEVHIDLCIHKPKTTKRLNPRGDIDNYIKAVLDAITKRAYWHDDDQIVLLSAIKRWSHPNEIPHARTRIEQAE